MADRPETSDYTSLQERLGISPQEIEQPQDEPDRPQAQLMSFAEVISTDTPANVLPHNFADYLELVDWTGRAAREDKRGSIPSNLPPILQRLNIEPEQWLKASNGMERHFRQAIGPIASLEQYCQRLKKRWLHGMNACRPESLSPVSTANKLAYESGNHWLFFKMWASPISSKCGCPRFPFLLSAPSPLFRYYFSPVVIFEPSLPTA